MDFGKESGVVVGKGGVQDRIYSSIIVNSFPSRVTFEESVLLQSLFFWGVSCLKLYLTFRQPLPTVVS